MDSRGDSWESIGWEAAWQQPDEEPDREQLLGLARRLAEQRERQRAEDLVQLEDLKRALRERAVDVAKRELEVQRRSRELEHLEARNHEGRRALRRRRPELPRHDEAERAYSEEGLARRETDLRHKLDALVLRERAVMERETTLRAREIELEEADARLREGEAALVQAQAEATERQAALESAREGISRTTDGLVQREADLVGREAELLRLQAGLAAQQESIRRRERALEDAERLQERELALPVVPYVSFSEGLDSLTGRSRD